MILALLVALVLVLATALAVVLVKLRQERGAPRRAAPPSPSAAPSPAVSSPPAARAGLARDTTLRSLLGLLAHEMRTPLGAIIGYGELLDDGLLGPLPERAADAVRRMETAGGQLRHLIDGLADLMLAEDEAVLELEEVDGASAAAALTASAQALAGGRGVQLDVATTAELPVLRSDPTRLAAALDLAVGAAIRASSGATLRLVLSGHEGGLAVTVEGTALDAARDLARGGEESSVSSGAGLRLLMATRMLHLLGGGLRIEGASPATLFVWIPARSIDGSHGQS